MATIKINDKEYRLKWTFRSMVAWEEIHEGKPFAVTSMGDYLSYLYCIFITANDTTEPQVGELVPYDVFLDFLSENETALGLFAELLKDVAKKKKVAVPMPNITAKG